MAIMYDLASDREQWCNIFTKNVNMSVMQVQNILEKKAASITTNENKVKDQRR